MVSPEGRTVTPTKERFAPASWGGPPHAVVVVDRAGTAARVDGEMSLLPGVEQGMPLPSGAWPPPPGWLPDSSPTRPSSWLPPQGANCP